MGKSKEKYKEIQEIFSICDLPKYYFEAATKEKLWTNKVNPNIEKNLRVLVISFSDKVVNV